jgi:SAM-dependent methyltransferase
MSASPPAACRVPPPVVLEATPEYDNREERHRFLAQRFGRYLTGRVLNIGGGGEKHLLRFLQPAEYLELDIAGDPDLRVDLDAEYPWPIDDGAFDAVICTEVLEHLDELHRAFSELLRITRRYAVISVPNALPAVYGYLLRRPVDLDDGTSPGIGSGQFAKFYGLPFDRPGDRHRWFFAYSESRAFFHHHAGRMGYRVVDEYATGVRGFSLKGRIARSVVRTLWGEEVMRDWFVGSYWCVLEKAHDPERGQ